MQLRFISKAGLHCDLSYPAQCNPGFSGHRHYVVAARHIKHEPLCGVKYDFEN